MVSRDFWRFVGFYENDRSCQLKVSMDLSISRESLSYYENGKRSPDIEMLVRLSKYFNVSIDYLITGQEFLKIK